MADCSLLDSGIGNTVINGLASIKDVAKGSVTAVDTISTLLANTVANLTPITKDIDLVSAGELSNPFAVGTAPVLKIPEFGGPTIGDRESVNVDDFNNTAVVPGDAPGSAPTLDFSGQPGASSIEDPGSAPLVGNYTFPSDPTDTIPGIPQLLPIVIPSFAPLDFPEFTATEPTDPGEDGFGVFDWTETAYTGTVQDEVVAQIEAILGGSTGIPDLIWDMIEQRGRRQIRATARQAREEATDYWASKGHFLSNGQLRKRVKEAGDKEAEGVSELVRELVIQDGQIYVERLNTALAQGIALEGQLIGLHNNVMEREFQAAKAVFDIALQVAGFKLTRYNIRMQGFQISAQVYQIRIQAEVAKLEELKAEIEIEKLKGTINLQTLEAYKAQIAGIIANYDVFKSLVDSVVAKYEADKIRVEAFAEEVNIFEARHRAYEIEWKGYGEKVKSQVAVMEGYKVEGEVFGSRVSAYAAGVNADKAESDAKVNVGRIKVEEIRANLDRLGLLMDKEKGRVGALQQVDVSNLKKFELKVGAEQTRISADAQRLNALISDANMLYKTQVQKIQLEITDVNNQLNAQLNAYNNTLQAQASVGSSAFTALNYAATLSDQFSNSHSCQDIYSH